MSGALVLHPVQEYSVHHGIGFRKPINAVRFHLPPGLSLQSQRREKLHPKSRPTSTGSVTARPKTA
jgi:hypothetical protein